MCPVGMFWKLLDVICDSGTTRKVWTSMLLDRKERHLGSRNSKTTNQVVGFDSIFLFKFIPTKRRGESFMFFFFCQVGALLGHEGPQSLTALLRGRGAMGEASFTWAKANLIYHNLYQEVVFYILVECFQEVIMQFFVILII